MRRLNILARRLRQGTYLLIDIVGTVICYFPFLLLREKRFTVENSKKILVIRIDRIGDVILSTPVLSTLRYSFPNAEIHMLIAEYTRDLLIKNPNIDRLLVKEDHLDKDYDLAIVLHPGFYQNYLSFASCAKIRV